MLNLRWRYLDPCGINTSCHQTCSRSLPKPDHWNDLGNDLFPSPVHVFHTPLKPWFSRGLHIFGTIERGCLTLGGMKLLQNPEWFIQSFFYTPMSIVFSRWKTSGPSNIVQSHCFLASFRRRLGFQQTRADLRDFFERLILIAISNLTWKGIWHTVIPGAFEVQTKSLLTLTSNTEQFTRCTQQCIVSIPLMGKKIQPPEVLVAGLWTSNTTSNT